MGIVAGKRYRKDELFHGVVYFLLTFLKTNLCFAIFVLINNCRLFLLDVVKSFSFQFSSQTIMSTLLQFYY